MPIDLATISRADVARVSAFLHEHLDAEVSAERWARAIDVPWSPELGYMLLEGDAVGQWEAKLRVLLTRPHVLMRLGFDARRDPHEQFRRHLRACESLDLVERVDHDPAYGRRARSLELVRGLVIAVKEDPLTGETRAQGGLELSPGADIEAHSEVVDQLAHR